MHRQGSRVCRRQAGARIGEIYACIWNAGLTTDALASFTVCLLNIRSVPHDFHFAPGSGQAKVTSGPDGHVLSENGASLVQGSLR